MTLRLTQKSEAIIAEIISSGHYADAGDVIEQGLLLLNERERRERIKFSIAEGFAAIDRGEGIEGTPEFWDQIIRDADEADRLGLPIDPDVCP